MAQKVPEDVVEVVRDRLDGLTQAFQEDDPAALARHLLCPETEAGLIGRDRRNGVGRTFQGGIAPGFVVGGKDPEIASGQGFVVGHIDQAVVAVQIGRDEDDLDPVLREVLESETVAGLQDGIGRLIVEAVGGDRRISGSGSDRVALEGGNQVRVSAENEEEGEDRLAPIPVRCSDGRGPRRKTSIPLLWNS